MSPTQHRMNMHRRFKWALSDEYAEMYNSDPAKPDFAGFRLWRRGVMEEVSSLRELILSDLMDSFS